MKSNTLLFFVEVDVIHSGDLFVGLWIDIKEVFDDVAIDEVFLDNALNIANLHGAIEGILWVDFDEWALGAEAEATNVVDADSVAEAFLFDELFEFSDDFFAVVR